MCCENPIELDCISSCESLILPVEVTEDFVIKTSFNGSNFNVSFAINSDDFAVVDKTNLNEDYTYTFGVYNAEGEIAGCYKISIHPAAICCDNEQTPSTERVVMDVANLNSDTFLTEFVTNRGCAYGYECVACKYNGESIALGSKMMFDATDLQYVPVQVAPRDTVPAHTINAGNDRLTYDKNFIDFLQSLPIADYIDFGVSPMGGSNNVSGTDHGFPESIVSILIDEIATPDDLFLYGESFQIEYPKGAAFSFKINFIYADTPGTVVTVENPYGDEIIGHNILYKDNAYYIDGALVYPANMRIIQNV